jgi:hypothetical protein
MKGLKVSFDLKTFEVIAEVEVETDAKPDYTLDNMLVEKAIHHLKNLKGEVKA